MGDLIIEERRVLLKKRRDTMFDKSREAARLLRERHGAEEVYLFGSLATGRIREDSDIDLMVVGAPPDPGRISIAAEIERLLSPFEGHIVFADEVSDSMRDSTIKRGVRLD